MFMGPPRGGIHDRFMPKKQAKNRKRVIGRIVKIYMRWGRTIIAALLLTILSSIIGVFVPYFTGRAFNTFDVKLNQVNYELLIHILIILLALNVASWLISTISGFIMVRVSQKLVYTLRAEFFEKMQRLPLNFYDTRSHGDTMSRITNDADNISSTIALTTTHLLSSVLMIAGTIVMMVVLNIPLTIVVFCAVPLVFVLTKTIATNSRKYFSAQQRNLGILNGMVEESISDIQLVKAFSRQEHVKREFMATNEELFDSSLKAQIWAGYMMPLSNVINNFIFALVAITGGYLLNKGVVTLGVVITFLTYSKQFTGPLNGIANIFSTIQSALASAERVFEVLDLEEESKDAPNAIDVIAPKGEVTFEKVSFSYDKNIPVLQDISFSVKAGEVIALVGETGAGKTTIVNLITHFYDVDSGSIYIDGVDIRDIKRTSLQNCFSVVLQDTTLFTGSIMDNIRYARPDATDSEVINAAKLAHADEFIDRLPQKYETLVSGSADVLSEGQKQLLAISRALLSNSPILILDEATSSVDTKTEKDIQRALLKLMKNHTSFLIAHRLSTIRDADRIMVIGDGVIKESGNHHELMEKRGEYYKMVMSQLGGYVE